METRFMFPASRSQQVMDTEYAFSNAVMGVRKRIAKRTWSIMQRALLWNKADAKVKIGAWCRRKMLWFQFEPQCNKGAFTNIYWLCTNIQIYIQNQAESKMMMVILTNGPFLKE